MNAIQAQVSGSRIQQRPRLNANCFVDALKINIRELQQGLLMLRRQLGLAVGNVNIVPISRKPCVSAGINPKGWDIEMEVNPSFDFATDRRVQFYCRLKKLQSAAEAECADVLVHECGHRKLPNGIGCPGDLDTQVKCFLEPIAQELQRQKKQPHAQLQKGTLVEYFANLVTDFINNTNCKSITDMAGQVLFWYEQGINARNEKYTKLYEAFVRLNLYAWGDRWDNAFLRRFFTNDSKVEQALAGIISELDLKNSESHGFLTDKNNWENVATVIAKYLIPLYEEQEPLFALFGSGDGVAGQKPQKEDLVLAYYKDGKPAPAFMEKHDALRNLYRRLARDIKVIAPSLERSTSFPFAPMKHRPFDPTEDDPLKIARKIAIGKDGRPALTVATVHLNLPFDVKHGIESFPPISFCVLDTSDSMKLNPDNGREVGSTVFVPWGDKSKYHFSLLGFFGLINYLSSQNLLARVNVNSANFSSQTLVGMGLQDAITNLLTPQWGSTAIDMNKLKPLMKPKGLVFTLSDGEVFNWSSIKDEFIAQATKSYFFHLQIGAPSQMSHDLEAAGLVVIPCKGNQDIANLVIDLTSKTYSAVVRNVSV